MTQWLAAAKRASEAETKLTEPTKPNPRQKDKGEDTTKNDVLSVLSVLSEANETTAAKVTQAESAETEAFPHGVSVAGRPLTWTGRVVSLQEWRRLTHWERNGPGGRRWCGIKRAWEDEA